MKQKGFFDEADRLKKISELGDSLEKPNEHIEWNDFQRPLSRAFEKEAKGPGGRPPFDYVMMFKILILQKIYNISDDQTEYQINDRLSFQRFIGIQLYDTVPDAKTIWHFREILKEADILEKIFMMFTEKLEKKGVITHSGSIVDATFVEAPRQRNTKEENKEIKEGKIPQEWQAEENRHKIAQKDTDARWTTKNKERHYGYKDHIKIEMNRIHEKGYRNRPLTKTQKRNNTAKSRIRARVEHVFAAMNHFGGIAIRTIGIARAEIQIGLLNLAYNLTRYASGKPLPPLVLGDHINKIKESACA